MSVTLSTPVGELPGVTERQAGLLRTLGLTNLGRLVAHLPMRFERVDAEAPVRELTPGRIVSARGEIAATRPVRHGRPRFEAVLMDDSGRLDLVWFNQMYLMDKILPGMRMKVQGKATSRAGGIQLVNPKWWVVKDAEPGGDGSSFLRPVYPATEDLPSTLIWKIVTKALPLALPLIDDHLPEAYRSPRDLPELRDAYRMQHAPAEEDETTRSRRRLAYDELLLLQLGVHLKRAHLRERLRAPALKHNAQLDAHIRARFPFTLTPSQDEVIREIAEDLSRATPANRLIQGDVGSGKTVIALYAMLLAVASRHQASLMAPTELLAEQHYAGISRILAGSKVRVALLTGGTPRAERDATLAGLTSGEIDLLVGTHALLTEGVVFKSLAVAVIDEQHRFGVHQRARLRAQGSDEHSTPHVLVMTATPIPRTMAITLFGDLDISTIRALPPGRTPIATRIFTSSHRAQVYAEVAERLARGEQAYIVVPAVEGGEGSEPLPGTGPLRDVRSTLAELESGPLSGFRIAPLHARLSRDTREAVMERFRLGEIQAMVATTVIEVGVDVPNATAMVIEQADRFGLAQLHQLRGRVGRGAAASACYLIADPTTDEARQRLNVIGATNDGFVLAEKDLEIRGPGELFGTRQSGLPPFRVADLMRDRELLNMARRDAAAWIKASPHLDRPEEALVKRRLKKTYGDALGLADVG